MNNRKNNVKANEHRYSVYGNMADGCIYCGDFATHRDHVPPISKAESINPEKHRFIKVPACQYCNTKLSNVLILTINDRKAYLRRTFKLKHRNMPHWDEDDLEDMNDLFRTYLKACEKEKVFEEARYSGLCVPIYPDPMVIEEIENIA